MQDLPTSSSLVVSHEGHKHNITQLAGPKWKLHGGLLNQKSINNLKQLDFERLFSKEKSNDSSLAPPISLELTY